MAWRIDSIVVKGEIDNRVRGQVRGRIWLLGREQPVLLDLKGDCHRDIAGCLVSFVNPKPENGDNLDLRERQEGLVGDMTASRKVFILDVSVEEAMQLGKAGKDVPKHQGNCLYIEWFSPCSGRVVIESTEYQVAVSVPAWTMSAEDYEKRIDENQKAFSGWLQQLDQAMPSNDHLFAPGRETPLDEYEWEQLLRESDRKADKFGEVLEKYMDDPDADRLIAREMGWEHWEETAEDDEEEGDVGDLEDEFADEDLDPIVPNPLTEGKDWVRDEEGGIHHPLYARSFELSMRIWKYCEKHGLQAEGKDPCVHDMTFQLQCCSAKLAGALNSLAYDTVHDYGFVVASMKRALNHLHTSLHAAEEIAGKQLMDAEVLRVFREEMFVLREDILRLMQEFRSRLQ